MEEDKISQEEQEVLAQQMDQLSVLENDVPEIDEDATPEIVNAMPDNVSSEQSLGENMAPETSEIQTKSQTKMMEILETAETREEADGSDKQGEKQKKLYFTESASGEKKAFLVIREKTFEIRTDKKLGDFLKDKYESVMESRYFGRGGIELVKSGQLTSEEMEDLVRLSYDLTRKIV